MTLKYRWLIWSVGCFGFSDPLRQYFSLYLPERGGKRRERTEESKNVQTTPIRTCCKRNRPLPYYHRYCRTPRHWKFTQDIAPPDHPQSRVDKFCCFFFHLFAGFPEKDRSDIKPCLTRFKNWGSFPCQGHFVRGICHFGVGDLPLLSTRPELFANKFNWRFQRYAFKCMEQLHFNRTRDSFRGNSWFSTTFYEEQIFVRKKID